MMLKESVFLTVLAIVSVQLEPGLSVGYGGDCSRASCDSDLVCMNDKCRVAIGATCSRNDDICESGSSCEMQAGDPNNWKCTKHGTLYSPCKKVACNPDANIECVGSTTGSRCQCKEGFLPNVTQGGCTKPDVPTPTLLEILNRTCIGEPAVPSFELPKGICDQRIDSCKHEMVKLSNGEEIMCDTQTDGGGWIIAKRRMTEHQNAFGTENYEDYKQGFGDLERNFWIGLETMHRFCPPKKPCDIRADMILKDGTEQYIQGNVTFEGAWNNYRIDLTETEKSGSAVPYFRISGYDFAAPGHPGIVAECVDDAGGWWLVERCMSKGLTGKDFIAWYTFSEIKLRRQAAVPST